MIVRRIWNAWNAYTLETRIAVVVTLVHIVLVGRIAIWALDPGHGTEWPLIWVAADLLDWPISEALRLIDELFVLVGVRLSGPPLRNVRGFWLPLLFHSTFGSLWWAFLGYMATRLVRAGWRRVRSRLTGAGTTALVLLVLVLLTSACGTFEVGVAGTPTPPETEASVSTEPTTTVHATRTSVPPETPSPVPTATATASPAPTASPTPAPVIIDRDSVQWEEVPDDNRLRRLAGINGPVLNAEFSPDGTRVAVEIAAGQVDFGIPPALLYTVDVDGEHPIGYTSRYGQRYNDINKYTWLSDGRLLWIDHEGTLLTGTRNHQIKLAPDQIEEVWVGPNNRVAVAAGTTDLWRVDLADETWDRIEGTDQLPREEEEPILSQVGANLSIAPSGTYAAAVVEGTLWRIPLDGNGEPTHLGSAGYPDTDVRHAAPKPLVDSPYWALRELVRTADGEVPAALLNSQTGAILSATGAGVEGQPHSRTIPSPDGRWLAVPLRNGTASLYVAPSSDLYAGSTLEGDSIVKAWDQHPVAVIMFWRGTNDVVRWALPAGEATTLVSATEDVPEHKVAAVTTSVGTFVALGDTLSLVRDDGTMLAQRTFSDGVRLFDARGDRALVRRSMRLRYDPPSPLLLWDAGISTK